MATSPPPTNMEVSHQPNISDGPIGLMDKMETDGSTYHTVSARAVLHGGYMGHTVHTQSAWTVHTPRYPTLS